jgi:hypothetical protein
MTNSDLVPFADGVHVDRREKPRMSGHDLYLDYVKVCNALALAQAEIAELTRENKAQRKILMELERSGR